VSAGGSVGVAALRCTGCSREEECDPADLDHVSAGGRQAVVARSSLDRALV
jgi:hypothetical protein